MFKAHTSSPATPQGRGVQYFELVQIAYEEYVDGLQEPPPLTGGVGQHVPYVLLAKCHLCLYCSLLWLLT